MLIDRRLTPLVSSVRDAHNARVAEFQKRPPTFDEVVVELDETVERLLNVVAQLEVQVGVLNGVLQPVLEDGKVYLRFSPDSGDCVELTGAEVVVDSDGSLSIRF